MFQQLKDIIHQFGQVTVIHQYYSTSTLKSQYSTIGQASTILAYTVCIIFLFKLNIRQVQLFNMFVFKYSIQAQTT